MLFNIRYQLNPWGTYITLVYFMHQWKWKKKKYTHRNTSSQKEICILKSIAIDFFFFLSNRIKIKLRSNYPEIYFECI